eukprot:m.232777 g.232777  ORF g.232777 m.232777 type:complete len:396 (+) comp18888_c0_seq10:321-1508(+)
MGEVSYVRAPPSGLVDHAAAIVDIVGTPPQLVGDSPIAMAGFAHKHGFRFCSWRKRFFRLRNDVIEYYRRMDSKAAKGVIRLSPLCRCWECHVGDPRHPKAFGYVKLVDGRPVVEVVQRPHGVVVFVPEQERAFYIHFSSEKEQRSWFLAIANNLEHLRRSPAVVARMISLVEPVKQIPRAKLGIVKMALRSRFAPRLDTESTEPFVQALVAASQGNLPRLDALVSENPGVLMAQTETGVTVLLKATTVGNLDVVNYALQHGADVNQQKSDGDTPLMIAARLNHSLIVAALLSHGADASAQNAYQETAMSEAQHNDGVIKELLNGTGSQLVDVGPEQHCATALDGATEVSTEVPASGILRTLSLSLRHQADAHALEQMLTAPEAKQLPDEGDDED